MVNYLTEHYRLTRKWAIESAIVLLSIGMTPKWIKKYRLSYPDLESLIKTSPTVWKSRLKRIEEIKAEIPDISDLGAKELAISYGSKWRKRVKELREKHGKNWKNYI